MMIPISLQLVTSDDSNVVSLGLSALLIASEELINPKDLTAARKLEIRRHFESHIPYIFFILNGTFSFRAITANM